MTLEENAAALKFGLPVSAIRLLRGLIYRELDDQESQDLHVHLLKSMLGTFPVDLVVDLESGYSKLDMPSKKFVSDVITGYTSFPFASKGHDPAVVASALVASTIIAPVLCDYEKAHGVNTSTSYCEEVAINVSYAFRMARHAINWSDNEIATYTRGSALLAVAQRREEISFENVIWLGKNSEKLKRLIDRIAEVSADPDYLQPLLEDVTLSLAEGAL